MTDRNESSSQQELDADDATLAFNALRHAVEKLSRNLDGEMTIIRKGVEAAFDRFDGLSQQPDFDNLFETLAEHLVLLTNHIAALEASPALRYGPEDYGHMFEVIADRVVVNLSRARPGGSSDINAVRSDLGDLVKTARDRDQQDRWLLVACLTGLLIGGLLTLTLVRAWPALFL